MTEKKEDRGAVTEHLDVVDDMQKSGTVKEANVASVALGMLPISSSEVKNRTSTLALRTCLK